MHAHFIRSGPDSGRIDKFRTKESSIVPNDNTFSMDEGLFASQII